MILILTQIEDDPPVLRLSQLLQSEGAEPIIIGPATLEQPSSLMVANDPCGGARTVLRLGARVIDLTEVRSAWLWRGWRPHPLLDQYRPLAAQRHAWQFFADQWRSFDQGFSLLLAERGVFCVNPPPWNVAFEEKCCQLALAAEVGLTIPPTLFTTQLPVAHTFGAAHGGSLVYKPFRTYVEMVEGHGDQPSRVQRLLSNRVAVEDLVEGEGFVPTPGIFQPYVDKQVELRIVVVGRRLFGCAIHSQRSERSREDWRRYDLENTPYEPYEVPPEIAARIHRLMDRLGLVFGSIDMIVIPASEHVFLEVNPNGQFDFVARLTGLPIYEHLASMLLAGKVEDATDSAQGGTDAV